MSLLACPYMTLIEIANFFWQVSKFDFFESYKRRLLQRVVKKVVFDSFTSIMVLDDNAGRVVH